MSRRPLADSLSAIGRTPRKYVEVLANDIAKSMRHIRQEGHRLDLRHDDFGVHLPVLDHLGNTGKDDPLCLGSGVCQLPHLGIR